MTSSSSRTGRLDPEEACTQGRGVTLRRMATAADAPSTPELETLHAIERRVLWLAAAIVHHANRVRPNRSGIKVGGHQASSASMVSLMTALWFAHLEAPNRV